MDCPLFDNHLQVAFVDRDQEVEALAAHASAEPFTDRVGPGRPNRSSKNSHSEACHFLIQPLGEDGVSVVDHETIGMVTRKRLTELLQGPFRSRMSGHVVVEDAAASPFHQHTNTYRFRKVAVTTTKKSQATMTWAWLWMKVSQRCLGSGVRAGPPPRR